MVFVNILHTPVPYSTYTGVRDRQFNANVAETIVELYCNKLFAVWNNIAVNHGRYPLGIVSGSMPWRCGGTV